MSETMTARQAQAWVELIAEASEHIDDLIPTHLSHWGWTTRWEREERPGRGQDMSATFLDGEHVVHIWVDVYGSGGVSVGEVSWLHRSNDEECPCPRCTADREAD